LADEARVIRTSRLLLRPVAEADADDFVRFYGDPAVMAIRKFGVMPPDQARAQHAGLLEHWRRHGFGMCAVVIDGAFAGECGLRWREDGSEVEVSYGLLPAHRGKGLATEAASAVLGWGFQTLKLPQIVAYSRGDNVVSHRVLERIGMRKRWFRAQGEHGLVSFVADAPTMT
jgi:ribosomal-protein-alanine N-acetyltransferase